MVVNGKTWPKLEVAPERYRFRILNAADSNFLNLALFTQDDEEVPLYVIGSDQGFLPHVVKIRTGYFTKIIPCDNETSVEEPQTSSRLALLMGPGERYDVIVDFSGIPDGTEIILRNTAPDEPFKRFDSEDVAHEQLYHPANNQTTGQVLKFIVNEELMSADGDLSTPPDQLRLKTVPISSNVTKTRDLAILEVSSNICVKGDHCDISETECDGENSFGPIRAMLGYDGEKGPDNASGGMWMDPIVINPSLGDVEIWEIWNWSEDAHPIHVHLVAFQIVGRFNIKDPEEQVLAVRPWENGLKDTVIAYPGQITKIMVPFEYPGLTVWHCHILSHEDNEMMLPFCVGERGVDCPASLFLEGSMI